jgi:hypothetical protein
MVPEPMLNRRHFIYSSASTAGLLAAPAFTSDLLGQPVRTLTPEQTLQAWMKLAGALDDRLVIWWMDGTRYGVVESHAKALYGMKVGIFQRYFEQPDGYWKLAMFELTYYTDLKTGKLLEQFHNPYTGDINKVRHVRLGPDIRHQTIAGQLADPDDKAVQTMLKDYVTTLGPAVISGDSLAIPSSVAARIDFPKPTAPDIRLNIYTTAMGKLSDAENPAVISAPCSFAFQNILKWEPWMNMGDHPGTMMSRATGRKLEDPDELPADYLEMARTVHPWLIKDPLESLAAKVDLIRQG